MKLPRRMLLPLTAVALGALAVLVAMRYSRPGPPATEPDPDFTVAGDRIAIAPKAPQWQVLKLAEAAPASARWTDPVPGRVKIDERLSSKVGTPLAGRVVTVFVDLGQRVKTGDPLFSVVSPELAELRAQNEKAQVDVESARTALDRVHAMVAARAIPAKEELAAGQQLKQAEVAWRLAQAKIASLHVEVGENNQYLVSAPRDGVVVERQVAPDQQVTTDSGTGSLVVVADLSSVLVVGELFEADAIDVREGAAAEVRSSSVPDAALAATVDMVSAVVDPARHTVPIRTRVANPEGQLRPNGYVLVRFALASRGDAVELPASALISDGAAQHVYVAQDTGFLRREVVAGPVSCGRVTILSGLTPGTRVVAEGGLLLDNQIDLAAAH